MSDPPIPASRKTGSVASVTWLGVRPLRAAQRVVHLEERAKHDPEGDRDQRRIVAAGAQHRKQQHRAEEPGDAASRQHHEQMRERRMRPQHRRRVRAGAEEGGPGEVHDAAIAELHREPLLRPVQHRLAVKTDDIDAIA